MARERIILIGGGGHAKVVCEIASLRAGIEIIGYTDVEPRPFPSFPYLGRDEVIKTFSPRDVVLANGIGRSPLRREIYERFKKMGYLFPSLIHSGAIVSASAKLSEGVQVMAGAVINAGSFVGENVIINTSSSVDHDCHIGAYSHIAPGVTLCGSVRIETGCRIGAGTTIIEGITIEEEAIIGAGSLVLRNIPPRVRAFGAPARIG